MADKRAYFKLDVGYLTNPKVAEIAGKSATAVLLHVGSIGYAAQHLTDGEVPVTLLLRLTGATQEDADLLFDSGLWEVGPDGRAMVHDYLSHQRSASEVKDAVQLAKKAAAARWNAEGNADSNAERIAEGNAEPMRNAMHREIGEREEISRPRKRALPEDFRPSQSHIDLAAQNGVDLRGEWPQFVDHHKSKGSVMKDWDAALRTWIRNAKKFGRGGPSLALVEDPSQLPPVQTSWMERR